MKQSTIKLLETIAENVVQMRRVDRCSRAQTYAALDALYDLYDMPYLTKPNF